MNLVERLTAYRPPANGYDEFCDPSGAVREPWKNIIEAFRGTEQRDLSEHWQYANRLLRENGTNITGLEHGDKTFRPWEIDLLPAVFSQQQWGTLKAGVAQRARLVEAIARDLYGPQKLLVDGVIPPDVLYHNPQFERAFHNFPANASPLLLYGCELARSHSGKLWVLADRASAPAGLSYALENRIVISSTLSQVLHRSQICRLAPFFVKMQDTIKRFASRRKSNPFVVILTAGPQNPFYFEDVFMARYLGFPLVEAEDLTVRKQDVLLKTLEGLHPVDVIIRRDPEQNLDPLETGRSTSSGIAGLLQVIRSKKVVMANGLEYGLLDSPVIMPFLPRACEELLGETLLIPSIATWWCGQAKAYQYVRENFENLVLKPAFAHSGSDEYIVSDLAKDEKEKLLKSIQDHPENYVAQEKIVRSTSPCWVRDEMRPGHLALRTFAVKSGKSFDVMDGGLIRVQTTSDPMTLSVTAGQFSKDVWVRSETPVPPVSLLKRMTQTPRLRRSTMKLQSRAADNLFWLGRYLERLEFAGRTIRHVTQRLAAESAAQPVDDVRPLIHALASQGIIDESFGVKDFYPERNHLEEVWPKLVRNTDDSARFPRLKNEVYRLASLVRDRMSEDFWRAISHLNQTPSQSTDVAETTLGRLIEEMNRVVLDASATTGQIMDGLVHGPTRTFLLIGRYLERAHQLSLILKHFLTHMEEDDVLSLVTLLDVCNSLMTYRSRYRASFSRLPVIDLVVTDPGNPRSLVFQFKHLRELISGLPAKRRQPQIPPYVNEVKRALFEIESILPAADHTVNWSDYQKNLQPILDGMEPRIKSITRLLTQNFFVHVGYTQQIKDRPDR